MRNQPRSRRSPHGKSFSPLLFAVLALLLPWAEPLALSAQQTPPGRASGGEEAVAGSSARVLVGDQVFVLPVTLTAAGPLFSLEPLVAWLGGELERGAYGEGYSLTLLDRELLFGPESPVVTSGEQLFNLSQAPQGGPGGLKVPLDFLDLGFGQGLGYRFDWDRATLTLKVERSEARQLAVQVELVHLQGTTTVVLEFSRKPRYRIQRLPGFVEVEILRDRLVSEAPAAVRDPLVRRVLVQPERIRIELAPDASAQDYVLEQPFRLVFDVYPELRSAPDPQPEVLQPPRRRSGIRTIVIDPGHGGTESGAVGPSGAMEKDLTLTLAQSLRSSLERRLPVRVVLTRGDDSNLPLETRTSIANQNKADLFISLHLNSSYGPQAHGAETYILSMQASDALAAGSAEEENRSATLETVAAGEDVDPLYDLQLILWDMAQSHSLEESLRFASLVQEELNGALKLRDRGVKQAPFRVLMGAGMPAVLVEVGFLSNPGEEAKLLQADYRSDLVEALTRAVERYRHVVEDTPAASRLPAPAADESASAATEDPAR